MSTVNMTMRGGIYDGRVRESGMHILGFIKDTRDGTRHYYRRTPGTDELVFKWSGPWGQFNNWYERTYGVRRI